MIKILILIFLLCLSCKKFNNFSKTGEEIKTIEVLIKFKDGISEYDKNKFVDEYQFEFIETIKELNIIKARLPHKYKKSLEKIQKRKEIEYIELDEIQRIWVK